MILAYEPSDDFWVRNPEVPRPVRNALADVDDALMPARRFQFVVVTGIARRSAIRSKGRAKGTDTLPRADSSRSTCHPSEVCMVHLLLHERW
jgi:hypothetical protein